MNGGARARELLIPTLLRCRTTHGHAFLSPHAFFSFIFYSLVPPLPSPFSHSRRENGIDVTKIANFICYFLSARRRERRARELKRDDNAATASFTRLARDIYHARDILIKCDDTPRSIRTKRVYALAPNTYARR